MGVKVWLKGALAAFIGGAGAAVSLVIVHPEDAASFKKLGLVCLGGGLISLGMYLKQSPIWK